VTFTKVLTVYHNRIHPGGSCFKSSQAKNKASYLKKNTKSIRTVGRGSGGGMQVWSPQFKPPYDRKKNYNNSVPTS
jgi:hypothetical protein